MKIEDENHMLEVENMLRAIIPVEVFIEPYIDTKYDIHLQVRNNWIWCIISVLYQFEKKWKLNFLFHELSKCDRLWICAYFVYSINGSWFLENWSRNKSLHS